MISKGWIKKLFKEADSWIREGIMDTTQVARLKDYYAKSLGYNRFISSIYILGAILLGLGLILFIASNWERLGVGFKVGLVFACIAGFNFVGYRYRFEKEYYTRLGQALLFLGAISFGVGIWLIAQIFQFPYNYEDGVLFWILGLLPVVFLVRIPSILILVSILLPIWLGVLIANTPQRIFYPFFLLLALVGYLVYRQKQRSALFFVIVSGGIWITHYLSVRLMELPAWSQTPESLPIFLLYCNLFTAYGFVLYGLGMRHNQHKNFSELSITYKLSALLLIFLSHYALTFVHHTFAGASSRFGDVYLNPAAGIVYVLYLAGWVLSLKRIFKASDPESKREAQGILLFLFLQTLLMAVGACGQRVVSFAYNVLLFAETLGFLYLGYLLRAESIFRLALWVFALNVLARYFDTFWNILPRSLFFILGGILLIGGGIYLERKRKAIEQKMKLNPDGNRD